MASAPSSPQVGLREVPAEVARPLLSPVDGYMTTEHQTVATLAAAGRCFVIEQDGRDVAAYVLQRIERECFVLAAAGSVDFDLTAFGLALIEAHAVGLDSVAFQTRRAGLIRKARRHGYVIAERLANGLGYVMRKELK